MTSKPLHVIKPVSYWNNAFREILDIWRDDGKITLEEISGRDPKHPHLWCDYVRMVRGTDNIVLYDLDNVIIPNRVSIFEIEPRPTLILFANETPNETTSDKPIPCSIPWKKWTYWPACPRMVHRMYCAQTSQQSPVHKPLNICFFGTVSDPVQRARRWQHFTPQDISKIRGINFSCVDKLEYPNAQGVSQHSYYQMIMRSKFGLSLPGLGTLCMREVEYAALGVVPIITPHCSVDFYNKWTEGENYFFAQSIEEIDNIVANTSENQRKEMVERNFEWYNKTCSPEAIWSITMDEVRGWI